MREFLITKLYCSVCGAGLEVCSPGEEKAEHHRTNSPGAPSGAYVSEFGVSVKPCRNCEWKHSQLRTTVVHIVKAAADAGVDLPGFPSAETKKG